MHTNNRYLYFCLNRRALVFLPQSKPIKLSKHKIWSSSEALPRIQMSYVMLPSYRSSDNKFLSLLCPEFSCHPLYGRKSQLLAWFICLMYLFNKFIYCLSVIKPIISWREILKVSITDSRRQYINRLYTSTVIQ